MEPVDVKVEPDTLTSLLTDPSGRDHKINQSRLPTFTDQPIAQYVTNQKHCIPDEKINFAAVHRASPNADTNCDGTITTTCELTSECKDNGLCDNGRFEPSSESQCKCIESSSTASTPASEFTPRHDFHVELLYTYSKQRLIDLLILTRSDLLETRDELCSTRKQLADRTSQLRDISQQAAKIKTIIDTQQGHVYPQPSGLGADSVSVATNKAGDDTGEDDTAGSKDDYYMNEDTDEDDDYGNDEMDKSLAKKSGVTGSDEWARNDSLPHKRKAQELKSKIPLKVVISSPDKPNKRKSPNPSKRVHAYSCATCECTFQQLVQYKLHLRTHTNEPREAEFEAVNEKQGTGENAVDDVKAHKCETCQERFTIEEQLQRHVTRAHSSATQFFKCMMCDMSFSREHHLVVHTRRHTGAQPYKCDVCDKTFSTSSSLTAHTRIHSGEKPFICRVCDKGFTQRASLQYHEKTHSEAREFTCDVCQRTFILKRQLERHVLVAHLGEKPFVCELCGTRFTSRYYLDSHFVASHPGYKAKRYVCDLCGKGYLTSTDFKAHLRVHNGERPFPCDVCGKTFAMKSSLSQHMFVHSGVKSFTCSACGKSFNNSGKLNRHSRVHSGARPYACAVCHKSFTQSGDLKRHSLTHATLKRPQRGKNDRVSNNPELENALNAPAVCPLVGLPPPQLIDSVHPQRVNSLTAPLDLQVPRGPYNAIQRRHEVEPIHIPVSHQFDPTAVSSLVESSFTQLEPKPFADGVTFKSNPAQLSSNAVLQRIPVSNAIDVPHGKFHSDNSFKTIHSAASLNVPLYHSSIPANIGVQRTSYDNKPQFPDNPPVHAQRPQRANVLMSENVESRSENGHNVAAHAVQQTHTRVNVPNNSIPMPGNMVSHLHAGQYSNHTISQSAVENLPTTSDHLEPPLQPYLSNFDLDLHRAMTPTIESPLGERNFAVLHRDDASHSFPRDYLPLINRYNSGFMYNQYVTNDRSSPHNNVTSSQWFQPAMHWDDQTFTDYQH